MKPVTCFDDSQIANQNRVEEKCQNAHANCHSCKDSHHVFGSALRVRETRHDRIESKHGQIEERQADASISDPMVEVYRPTFPLIGKIINKTSPTF